MHMPLSHGREENFHEVMSNNLKVWKTACLLISHYREGSHSLTTSSTTL